MKKTILSFLLVAKTRNITKSASEMHITQQALSRILAQLEDELETRLFIRTSGGTDLSVTGKKILPIIENLVEYHDQCMDMVMEVVRANLENFQIAFENNVLLNSYPPELLSRVGNYKIKSYIACDNETCIRHILSGQATFAFAMKPQNLQGLSYYPVVRRRHVVIMSKNHYLADRKELYIEDLKSVNHSWLSISSSSFDTYYKECMKRGFYPRITSEYPTAELQHQMLSAGQEITIGGGYIYTDNEENLVRIPLICDDFWSEAGFIYDKDDKSAFHYESYFSAVRQYYASCEKS